MTAAWVFFGVVGLLVLNGLYHFGVVNGVQVELASRLPGGSFLRECVVRPDVALGRVLDRVSSNPARWALGTAAFGIFVFGSIFSFVEDAASMPDGWWWAFVSMSTVGYGDISPATTFMRFLATFVIASGIASTAILTAALAGRITERRVVAPHHSTAEATDDLQVVIARERENTSDLERLLPFLSDPRVEAALREVHNERSPR